MYFVNIRVNFFTEDINLFIYIIHFMIYNVFRGDKMKYYKAEALLAMNGKTLSDYANYMNVSKQQISNKKKSDTFKVDDFIQLAELTGTQLAFIDKNGKTVITFDTDDLSD